MLCHNKTLGQQIAQTRKKRQLSQAQLAAITGMNPKFLSNIEAGHKARIRIYTLARLAAGLGVSIDELAGQL
ncbi:helix-turn-helix domain-containing protein [Desulfosporosinus meridiei]|uniref:Putative transcriptional regulator n=1 Tax=Desulfosporosinus meridiei (strain ATCC BAA-275 / DSM 13257 / KCTC 12902 / NCIMB 13706 / S10) TaxID=768704 RepID=J7IX76_DESMD|nr:helix-turn-helix transcriptional regulator [Desulfosporosinus meridiei]AFQ43291.1 putative transcriptional regulator [Desulfosporosinus meridiei DSM 13257]